MSDVAKVGAAGAGTTKDVEPARSGWLDRIERLGNKVPHPAIIFLGLCLLVIVLSWVLSLFSVSVTYDVAEPPATAVTQEYQGGTQVPDITAPPKD